MWDRDRDRERERERERDGVSYTRTSVQGSKPATRVCACVCCDGLEGKDQTTVVDLSEPPFLGVFHIGIGIVSLVRTTGLGFGFGFGFWLKARTLWSVVCGSFLLLCFLLCCCVWLASVGLCGCDVTQQDCFLIFFFLYRGVAK